VNLDCVASSVCLLTGRRHPPATGLPQLVFHRPLEPAFQRFSTCRCPPFGSTIPSSRTMRRTLCTGVWSGGEGGARDADL